MYYLGSRFYSPQLGRFLNADKHVDTGTGVIGTNMYAYCNNNPVMYADPTGEASLSVLAKLLNWFIKLTKGTGLNYVGYAEQILKNIGYLNADYSLYRYKMSSKGTCLELYYKTKKKTSTTIRWNKETDYVYGKFEIRTVNEWKELITKPLLQRIPLIKNIDDFCSEYPVYSDLISEIIEYSGGEAITLAWDFLDCLATFFDEEKNITQENGDYESILFTDKERYILKSIIDNGLTDNHNTYSFVGGELSYYLGSRFYSPRLGRFLNADKHTDTGTGVNGTNMYAYCNNNPVMFTDPTGESAGILTKSAIALFSIAFAGIAVYFVALEIHYLFSMIDFSCIIDALDVIKNYRLKQITLFKNFVKAVSLSVSTYIEVVIEEILEKAKKSSINNKQYDVHHIVSKSAVNAFFGRLILANVGIGTEDRINKVTINHRLHAYVNSNAYNWGVSLYLADIYDKTIDGNYYERVYNGLLLLKIVLLAASAMVS